MHGFSANPDRNYVLTPSNIPPARFLPPRARRLQEVLNRYRLRHGNKAKQQRAHAIGSGGRKSPGTATTTPTTASTLGVGVSDLAGDAPILRGPGVDAGFSEIGLRGAAVGQVAAGAGGERGGGVSGVGGKDEQSRKFPIRNMNVMNPLDCNDNQIDDTVTRKRAARMHSLLQVFFSSFLVFFCLMFCVFVLFFY